MCPALVGKGRRLGEGVVIALFTGTGNTLSVTKIFMEELERLGRSVSLVPMESAVPLTLPEGASLGLALPVACFSTYPTAWRFIDSLPDGGGRGAFLLATMGGMSMGMDGPIRRAVERKGYVPLGSKILIMPGNYNNKTLPAEKNARRAEAAIHLARRYAKALAEGSASWGGGVPLVSSLWARLGHTRIPWRGFYKIFPLTVSPDLCTGCGLCRDLCPERNISLCQFEGKGLKGEALKIESKGLEGEALKTNGGRARIGDRCQSCQRCIAFCPAKAIIVPGKPAEQYRGTTLDELSALIGKR